MQASVEGAVPKEERARFSHCAGKGLALLLWGVAALLLLSTIFSSLVLFQDSMSRHVDCHLISVSSDRLPDSATFVHNAVYAFAHRTVLEHSKSKDVTIALTRDCVITWPGDRLGLRIDRREWTEWCVFCYLLFAIMGILGILW
jgi:hypothetical protein